MSIVERFKNLDRLERTAVAFSAAVLVGGVVYWGLQIHSAAQLLALAYGWW